MLAMHVLLARRLAPADYGSFTLALAFALLVNNLASALLVEPYLATSHAARDAAAQHLARLLRIQHRATIVGMISAAVVGACALFAPPEASWLVVGAAALWLAPLYAWLNFMRRIMFALRHPVHAVRASLTVLLVVPLSLWGLAQLKVGGPGPALIALGAILGVIAWALERSLPAAELASTGSSDTSESEWWRRHWGQARWLLVAAPVRWLLDQFPLLLAAACLGLEAGALLRAVLNVIAPSIQILGSVRFALLPRFARAERAGHLGATTLRIAAGAALASVLQQIALQWLAEPILTLAYHHAEYAANADLLRAAAWIPTLFGAALMVENAVRARHAARAITIVYGAASVLGALLGLGFVAEHGVRSLVWAAVAGYGALLLGHTLSLRSMSRDVAT
jgi:O-antigen/teichoic acid export membrane protein